MSDEIKVVQSPIEESLSELKTAIQSLNTTFSKEIEGENVLDLVNKINEIKQSYANTLLSYQTLLTNNIEGTKQAVETLKETEALIASNIKPLKY